MTATNLAGRNLAFGIPVAVFSYIVGTTIFGTLATEPNIWVQVGAGVVSLTAGTLAALQTFMRYSERADKHQAASARYASVRREINQIRILPRTLKNTSDEDFLVAMRRRLDELAAQSPMPPVKWQSRVREELEKTEDYWALELQLMTNDVRNEKRKLARERQDLEFDVGELVQRMEDMEEQIWLLDREKKNLEEFRSELDRERNEIIERGAKVAERESLFGPGGAP